MWDNFIFRIGFYFYSRSSSRAVQTVQNSVACEILNDLSQKVRKNNPKSQPISQKFAINAKKFVLSFEQDPVQNFEQFRQVGKSFEQVIGILSIKNPTFMQNQSSFEQVLNRLGRVLNRL
jgi:hypothetical protein